MTIETGVLAFDRGEVWPGASTRGDADRPARVAIVGTYPPRQCGIATFTRDVVEQTAHHHPDIAFDIYALDAKDRPAAYPEGVRPLAAEDPVAYREAAAAIDASGADAVWLQHEYGIFGGPDGEMVCDFADRIAAPLILTLHTVLSHPSDNQRRILDHLLARASRVMVMSHHARDLLVELYRAPQSLIEVIEHGAPDRPFGRTAAAKEMQGFGTRPVLMTFGLLGPGKGLEHVIDALPQVLARHPDVLYRIVGRTHPVLVARDGESYREMLMERARARGVAHAIEWENRFLDTGELLARLDACDIFLTPYPNLQQSTSGTLSYAVALGKAVVATPYIHARELLANDVGVLVEPGDAGAIAEAVCALLDDPARLAAMQRRAWARGRQTIWPRFAAATAALVRSAIPATAVRAPLSVVPNPMGVFAMSDATGMLQHAIGTVPDRRHGYCLDDNVRALMWINIAEGVATGERIARAGQYASFIQHAWNPDAHEGRGAFRNFMRFDRSWCEDIGSEDSNGRTLWALGQTIETSRDPDLRAWARMWYDTALPALRGLRSPRTIAFVMLGAAARLRREPGYGVSRQVLAEGGAVLIEHLARYRSADWPWFETRLAYDNARLPQALLEAGELLGDRAMTRAGLETARWLAERQTAPAGHFRPVGSNGLGREHDMLPFDQQPLEALAAIDCARVALRASGDVFWHAHADAAWRWFFGANDRGAVLGDLATGRCRDGVTPRGRNENCGAESILALHLARHSMLALRAGEAAVSAGRGKAGDGRERQRSQSADPVPHL
ncbi:glycosyltransferase family 4 protein [Qipengyuania sediminis]|uniref:glycosyltransferase family 4 protein n=1 Tax=Qipengyuania sediminis TaxID=1532023 RepID=UPI001059BD91|nr:glycosyltransferase family 4 protein [Qipengyuania sediminis]